MSSGKAQVFHQGHGAGPGAHPRLHTVLLAETTLAWAVDRPWVNGGPTFPKATQRG